MQECICFHKASVHACIVNGKQHAHSHTSTHTKTIITMTFTSYAFSKAVHRSWSFCSWRRIIYSAPITLQLFTIPTHLFTDESQWVTITSGRQWMTKLHSLKLCKTLQVTRGKATRKLLKWRKLEPDKETKEEIDWCTDHCISDMRVQAMCGVHNVPVHLTIWKGNARFDDFDDMWSKNLEKPFSFFRGVTKDKHIATPVCSALCRDQQSLGCQLIST